MNGIAIRIHPLLAACLLLAMAGIAVAADPPAARAVLQRENHRKPAPEFVLKDRSGRTISLGKYRGKVVLLDFWATWCHGCKEEIPWFAEFQRHSDEGGRKVVKPFLKTAKVPYRIVMGDDATAGKYGIESMPGTFLIDGRARIAAAYPGLVEKDDVEAKLRVLLAEPKPNAL